MEITKQYIERGQTLRLKCYTIVTNVSNYAVNWESPMVNKFLNIVIS